MSPALPVDLGAARVDLRERGWAEVPRAMAPAGLGRVIERVAEIAAAAGAPALFGPDAEPALDAAAWHAIRREFNHRGALAELRKREPLREIAEALLEGYVESFPVWKLRLNAPGLAESQHPWHQDEWTWPAQRGREIVTFWLALTPVDASNGIELLGRSLRGRLLDHDRDDYQASIADPGILESGPRVAPVLAPGDAVAFDPFTLHRSLPNRSGRVRVSLDLRYVRRG